MQERGLPPAHPSLPAIPRNHTPVASSSYAAPATFGPSAPLTNPYAQSYSNHYAQAYNAATNSEGYAYSSTYNTSANASPSSSSFSREPSGQFSNSLLQSAAWYQPGTCRCTYKGCNFAASHKALETHMMDRHLVYPPGWEKRQKKPDWDTDPSLKGKPIPIQGTNLILEKPEDLEAWIAERKKRFPTAARVDDKKRKMEEASARGQLPIGGHGFGSRKRQRTDEGGDRDRGRTNNHARGRVRASDSGWRGRGRGRGGLYTSQPHETTKEPEILLQEQAVSTSSLPSQGDDEDAPEVVSSKGPIQLADEPPLSAAGETSVSRHLPERMSNKARPPKKTPLQPKKEPHNPFASRPTLLRNLLLPEIRVTISNLSQAIRFLVDNDFLQDVEEKPGDADEKMIEVIADDTGAGEAKVPGAE